ncbi:MAG TPA: hypothetical protein VE641_20175 [Chthoniobacterales bacterium]|jgi:hypothetical protein|nr:hypothetical protein [Chthoniobacterales bacterium]
MRDHIKILGILNIVMGCLTASIGLVALVILGGLAGALSWSGVSVQDSGAPFAGPILSLIGLGVAAFFVLLGLPSIIGGWGLLKLRPWSRVFTLVVSGFHLLHVPLGTALGVYGFWVLLSDEAKMILSDRPGGNLPLTYAGPSV